VTIFTSIYIHIYLWKYYYNKINTHFSFFIIPLQCYSWWKTTGFETKFSLIFLKFHPNPANRQSTKKHNMYQLLYIYSIPPDDRLQICLKHVEGGWRNKLRINCASSWFSLHGLLMEVWFKSTFSKVNNFSSKQNRCSSTMRMQRRNEEMSSVWCHVTGC
jgi:hypothetical protein